MKYLLFGLILLSSSVFANPITVYPKGSVSGRFQIVQISDMRRDQFLIDSQTGKLWHKVCTETDANGDCASSYWSIELVEGMNFFPDGNTTVNPQGLAKKKTKTFPWDKYPPTSGELNEINKK